jgi:hypothetical protein
MKIRPVGGELYHADRLSDGQTDRQTDRYYEASIPFSQFRERAWQGTESVFLGLADTHHM